MRQRTRAPGPAPRRPREVDRAAVAPSPRRDAGGWLAVGAAVACLLPFVGKAFHIDDPLFLWIGRHLQRHPADPYGFAVNWYGMASSIAEVSKNPPLASYYLALLGGLFGWGELPLHLGFLLPAAGAALATWLLAGELCRTPLLAALCAVLTPVFLVSGTTVMADTMLLAFWTLAIYLWVRGLRVGSRVSLAAAGLVVALASVTKYFGMFLLPLLAAYAIARRRGAGAELAYLVPPLVLLAAYQLATRAAYGHGLLLDAFSYAARNQSPYGRWSLAKLVVGLAYTGACLAVVLCFARRLWSRGALAAGAGGAAAVAVLVFAAGGLGAWRLPEQAGWAIALQLGLWSAVGAGVLALAGAEAARRRDPDSLLLVLWAFGTLAFAVVGNWSTNGRVLLPLAPAIAILLVRRLERRAPAGPLRIARAALPLAGAAALSLAVAAADATLAGSARRAAREIAARSGAPGRTTWFEGHWGFQWYMEAAGAKALVFNRSALNPGDRLILPRNNTNIVWPPPPWARHVETRSYTSARWLATMSPALGAGFYTDFLGPLPFAVGAAPPDEYETYEVAGAGPAPR